jgi:ketosteroid isomerase-like protein
VTEESTIPDRVGLVRQAVQALDSGDLDLAASFFTSDWRGKNPATAVTDNSYVGSAGVREWYSDMFDAFGEGARFKVEQIIAEHNDFVVGRVAIVGYGARSGAPLYLPWITVWWFSDDKIVRAAGYNSRCEALHAAGLEA